MTVFEIVPKSCGIYNYTLN